MNLPRLPGLQPEIAVQAIPEGQRDAHRITLRTRVRHDVVEVLVRDTGRGIPPHVLPHIFDPFYTTRLGRGGTGLGLAICQTLVTRVLGGSISVQSELEQGTRFCIDLPLHAPVVGTPGLAELPGPALPAAGFIAGP